MLDGSQHGGGESGSHAVPRRGFGPRSMMAFRGPSQHDVATLASRMQEVKDLPGALSWPLSIFLCSWAVFHLLRCLMGVSSWWEQN